MGIADSRTAPVLIGDGGFPHRIAPADPENKGEGLPGAVSPRAQRPDVEAAWLTLVVPAAGRCSYCMRYVLSGHCMPCMHWPLWACACGGHRP